MTNTTPSEQKQALPKYNGTKAMGEGLTAPSNIHQTIERQTKKSVKTRLSKI
jgi:hypothetical protein